MDYTYDKSPGGDELVITGCDEHGGIILVSRDKRGVGTSVCIAPEHIEEVVGQMRGWSRK